jgi:hypothetical protein
MPQAILFLDANVLYSACCRDLLLELALSGLCRCHWSEQVLAETRRALLRQRPDISGHNIDRLFALMSQACPDALTQTRRPPLPSEGAAKPRPYPVKEIAVSGWWIGNGSCLKISMGIGLWVTGIGKCCGLWPLVHTSHPSWSPFQFMPNPWSFKSVIRTPYSTQPSSPTFPSFAPAAGRFAPLHFCTCLSLCTLAAKR